MITDHTDTSTRDDVVALKVTTSGMQEDIKEIKENQKVVLDFITKQKAGRKVVWMLVGAAAGLLAIIKDFGSIFTSLFHR